MKSLKVIAVLVAAVLLGALAAPAVAQAANVVRHALYADKAGKAKKATLATKAQRLVGRQPVLAVSGGSPVISIGTKTVPESFLYQPLVNLPYSLGRLQALCEPSTGASTSRFVALSNTGSVTIHAAVRSSSAFSTDVAPGSVVVVGDIAPSPALVWRRASGVESSAAVETAYTWNADNTCTVAWRIEAWSSATK
jgi:hypothetical protein